MLPGSGLVRGLLRHGRSASGDQTAAGRRGRVPAARSAASRRRAALPDTRAGEIPDDGRPWHSARSLSGRKHRCLRGHAMIGGILAWWVASTVAGAAAFPIAWRVFDRLPDRGFGLSRTLGVLLGGYLLWLCASLGILRNNPGGAVAAMLMVGAGAILAGRGRWREMAGWLRANAGTVLAMETLFLVAFVAWAIVRAFNPEIVATEKPMELAFLNAILRSPQFPPQDPWLAGNAISYYYLGYVLLAWMTWLTGVSAGVAFNLGNALWFGLVAVGAYSAVFNLLGLRHGKRRRLAALLGPLMVLIVGNLSGAFEVMHAQHWFWETQPDGSQSSDFWTWQIGRASCRERV